MAGQGYREKLLEGPLCLTEPVPVGSRMDPPLAKADPTSDGSNASGITYLRRGGKKLLQRNNCGQRG